MINLGEKPFIIGISGGVGSGKNETCDKIKAELSRKVVGGKIVVLSLSNFYNALTEKEKELARKGEYDLDHPSRFEFDSLRKVLERIKCHEQLEIPKYDSTKYGMSSELLEIPSDVDVIIVEGIMTFYPPQIREILHLKIFIESDADTRLSRKVLHDVYENNRPLEQVLSNYFKFVKPAFEDFCLPSKKYADVILPRAPDNIVGMDFIIEHISHIMSNKGGKASQRNGEHTSKEELDESFQFRNSDNFFLPFQIRSRKISESSSVSIRPH